MRQRAALRGVRDGGRGGDGRERAGWRDCRTGGGCGNDGRGAGGARPRRRGGGGGRCGGGDRGGRGGGRGSGGGATPTAGGEDGSARRARRPGEEPPPTQLLSLPAHAVAPLIRK